ncbi:hypothetical protein Sjap_019435 [Stephania japonica]|uniref:Fanconi Anaemia group E protein C-terminal domain-containing protein n=1 Tax=Stephania japonica TaxID=461633 RepID=A0AAP0HZC6_9MAGN
MEAWIPLFNIFLNSPCPETEAALWMQNSFNDASKTTTYNTNTNSLLLLLSNPTDVAAVQSISSSPSQSKRYCISQIPISGHVDSDAADCGAVADPVFSKCGEEEVLWEGVVCACKKYFEGSEEGDFWVKKAARHLLDEMPSSISDGVSGLDSGQSDRELEEEFEKLPSWLESATRSSGSVFPWLPVSRDELRQGTLSSGFVDDEEEDRVLVVDDEELNQVADEIETEIVCLESVHIAPEIQSAAAGLKSQILTFESTSRTAELADQILQLYIAWPSHVLCSVILPKLLVLEEPASRVLMTAIIGFCKLHQKAAVDALLLPLVFRRDGINTPTCDLVTRVIKECLHSAHVSSYCQRLLYDGHEARGIMCLPCHQCLLSNELTNTFVTKSISSKLVRL